MERPASTTLALSANGAPSGNASPSAGDSGAASFEEQRAQRQERCRAHLRRDRPAQRRGDVAIAAIRGAIRVAVLEPVVDLAVAIVVGGVAGHAVDV